MRNGQRFCRLPPLPDLWLRLRHTGDPERNTGGSLSGGGWPWRGAAVLTERITVVNLVLDALGGGFAAYAREDAAVVRLHELLGRYKNRTSPDGVYHRQPKESGSKATERPYFHGRSPAGGMGAAPSGEMELAVKQAHIRMKKSSLCFCARCSVRTSAAGRSDRRRIQTELSHGFRFVADCFGEGRR